jgi:hypothetical protein
MNGFIIVVKVEIRVCVFFRGCLDIFSDVERLMVAEKQRYGRKLKKKEKQAT